MMTVNGYRPPEAFVELIGQPDRPYAWVPKKDAVDPSGQPCQRFFPKWVPPGVDASQGARVAMRSARYSAGGWVSIATRRKARKQHRMKSFDTRQGASVAMRSATRFVAGELC